MTSPRHPANPSGPAPEPRAGVLASVDETAIGPRHLGVVDLAGLPGTGGLLALLTAAALTAAITGPGGAGPAAVGIVAVALVSLAILLRRPDRARARVRLSGVLVLALSPLPALAQTGSVEPCLSPHGNRDLYRAGLAEVGWTDLAEDQRAAGLAMLADVYLPVTAPSDGTWAGLMAGRAGARAFWDDLAGTRQLMVREGAVLLLAGFRDDNGDVRVECWTAGPQTAVTESFFQLIGQIWETDGVQMTQVNLPATDGRPATELFVSRLTPPVAVEPPLTATDGLRTRITIPEAIP